MADGIDLSGKPVLAVQKLLADDLGALAQAATLAGKRGPPPLELWNPPFCGDIDMRIAADGTWFYLGTPIGRPALVKLFASIIRKDKEGYRLVTPVEKVGIIVDDAPFLAVEMRVEHDEQGQRLSLRTNVDEWVDVDAVHPLRFEIGKAAGVKPYVHVRSDLWALVTRAVYYDLVALGEARVCEGRDMFGIAAGTAFFPIAPMDEIEGLV